MWTAVGRGRFSHAAAPTAVAGRRHEAPSTMATQLSPPPLWSCIATAQPPCLFCWSAVFREILGFFNPSKQTSFGFSDLRIDLFFLCFFHGSFLDDKEWGVSETTSADV